MGNVKGFKSVYGLQGSTSAGVQCDLIRNRKDGQCLWICSVTNSFALLFLVIAFIRSKKRECIDGNCPNITKFCRLDTQ